MEKLFDLMLMGLKYQMLCSQAAQDILQVSALLGCAQPRFYIKTFFPITAIKQKQCPLSQTAHNLYKDHWLICR